MDKKCLVEKWNGSYGWKGDECLDDPADICILARAWGKHVRSSDLMEAYGDGIISIDEMHAIGAIDQSQGTEEDLEAIKAVGTRLGVQVEVIQ